MYVYWDFRKRCNTNLRLHLCPSTPMAYLYFGSNLSAPSHVSLEVSALPKYSMTTPFQISLNQRYELRLLLLKMMRAPYTDPSEYLYLNLLNIDIIGDFLRVTSNVPA